mgnify:CR=1 FL=1
MAAMIARRQSGKGGVGVPLPLAGLGEGVSTAFPLVIVRHAGLVPASTEPPTLRFVARWTPAQG